MRDPIRQLADRVLICKRNAAISFDDPPTGGFLITAQPLAASLIMLLPITERNI